MTDILGCDYASVDGNHAPDLARAWHAGIRFAILRGAWGTWIDPTLARDWSALGSAGMVRGAYLFLRLPAIGQPAPPSATAQAQAFLSALHRLGPRGPLDLPPALDVELPGRGLVDTGLTAAQALAWVREAWHALLGGCGVPPLVYTSERVWREDLHDLAAPELADSPLWIKSPYYFKTRQPWEPRRYSARGPLPVPWRGRSAGAWIHQISGDATGCPGFTSTVDGNRFLPMRPGESGDRVRWVQRRLSVGETGTYDARTVEAVRAMQRRGGLEADGVIGPASFCAIAWWVAAG